MKKDVEAYTSLYERLLVRADEIKSKETQFSKVIENEKRLLQDNWVRFKDEITKRQQRLEDSKYFFKVYEHNLLGRVFVKEMDFKFPTLIPVLQLTER